MLRGQDWTSHRIIDVADVSKWIEAFPIVIDSNVLLLSNLMNHDSYT